MRSHAARAWIRKQELMNKVMGEGKASSLRLSAWTGWQPLWALILKNKKPNQTKNKPQNPTIAITGRWIFKTCRHPSLSRSPFRWLRRSELKSTLGMGKERTNLTNQWQQNSVMLCVFGEPPESPLKNLLIGHESTGELPTPALPTWSARSQGLILPHFQGPCQH